MGHLGLAVVTLGVVVVGIVQSLKKGRPVFEASSKYDNDVFYIIKNHYRAFKSVQIGRIRRYEFLTLQNGIQGDSILRRRSLIFGEEYVTSHKNVYLGSYH